jgi:hypothetical protein
LADIQALGLGRAYEQAAGQYNTGISNMLGASGQLGSLGQQQFGQEMDITKGLGMAGDVQRQRQQALLDVDYGDYLTEQKYPYEQLAFQQGLVAGVPYSTTQRSAGQDITQKGKTVEQTMKTTEKAPEMAAGGVVGHYDEGGITNLLSDQQIDQRQQMPNISDLARLSLQATKMKYAQMRADQQNMDAQQAMMDQGRTVADDVMRQIAAARESGIAGLDVPDDLVGNEYTAAGGGIVAFSNLGEVPAMTDEFGEFMRSQQAGAAPAIPSFTPTDASDNRFARKPAPDMSGNLGRKGIAQLITPPADTGAGPAPSPKKQSSMVDDIYGPIENEIRAIGAAERKAIEDMEKDIKDEAKEGNSFTDKARERINALLKNLEGQDKNLAENTILQWGFGLLAVKGEKNKAKALSELGLNTLKGHASAMKDLQAKQERYEDAELELQKIDMGERRATRKEIRDLQLRKTQADTGMLKSMIEIMGDRGKTVVDLYKARLTAGGSGGSEKERLLAQLAKFPAGTEKGDQLRQNLEYLGEVGKPDPGLKNPNYKKKSDLLGMLEMRYSMTQDPKIKAQLESQINNTKIEMASMLRGGSGSVGGGGSGTLNAADQALLDKYR